MPSFPKRASARPGMTRESSVHPILGPLPGLPGHYHSGIMLAPLTEVLLKKMILAATHHTCRCAISRGASHGFPLTHLADQF